MDSTSTDHHREVDLSMTGQSGSYQNSQTCQHETPRSGDFVDEVLNKIGFGFFQIVAFCFIGVTYIAYIGEALTFAFISIPVMQEWAIGPLIFSSVSASTFLGNMIGEILLSFIADHYGRFWPHFISLVTIACLVLASAFSPNFYTFLILRMFASVGIGGVIILSFPILMEFLPVKMRGSVSILVSTIVACASCAIAGMAWWLVPNYSLGWRYFIVGTSIPAFFAVVFRLIFFIESPRLLMSKGDAEKAWKTFSIMAKMNFKQLEDLVSKEQLIKECSLSGQLQSTQTTYHSLLISLKQLSCILKPPLLRQTICLALLYSIQVMTAYGTTLFLPYNLKGLGIDPYICSFIAFVAEIPGILFLSIIIEWPEFGRRNTIRMASLVSAILYFLLAFVQNDVSIPVLTVLIYFFLVPMISVVMIYATESYPTQIRVMALAFIGNFTGFLSIGITFGAGYLAEQSRDHPWLSPTIWGSAFVVQLIIALLLKHDTRGRNLQDTLTEINNS